MKRFLAIFTCAEGSTNHQAWMKLDSTAQKERMELGLKANDLWVDKYHAQIIFNGGALGKTKAVNGQGIHDIPSMMGIFMIVEAANHDEAAKMFLNHPHFSIFPGDGVDVVECKE